MIELEGTRWPEHSTLWSIKLSFKEFFMHNLISYNQLSSEDDHDDLLAEYYECLIDCEDTASSCKRICKEVLV